jgi:predicted nucleotidyltransferase
MTEMTMLDLETMDIAGLCSALDDNSYESSWWLDPRTGEVRCHHSDAEDESVDDLDEAGLVLIEPIGSHQAYRDMEMFIAQVPDRRAADLLDRAIAGRGAFRRFKDTLFEFPELRERWFAYHDARMRQRALQWLADEGLISPDVAERHRGEHPEPVVGAGLIDVDRLVRDVTDDLRVLYGDRLAQVLVFGSQARGDAGSDSDVDLLIVLADLANAWEELRRMDEVLWRHTESSGITVSALPVSLADFRRPTSPVLIRAKAEAAPVT